MSEDRLKNEEPVRKERNYNNRKGTTMGKLLTLFLKMYQNKCMRKLKKGRPSFTVVLRETKRVFTINASSFLLRLVTTAT